MPNQEHITLDINFPQLGFIAEFRGLLHTLIKQGAQIMGLAEDLLAAQGNTLTSLGVIATEVTDLTTEVNTLISMIGQPGAVVTQAMVDQAVAISAQTQGMADAIKAIPGVPGGPTPPAAAGAPKSGKAFPGA